MNDNKKSVKAKKTVEPSVKPVNKNNTNDANIKTNGKLKTKDLKKKEGKIDTEYTIVVDIKDKKLKKKRSLADRLYNFLFGWMLLNKKPKTSTPEDKKNTNDKK